MKAKESAVFRVNPLAKERRITLDDVERLSAGNRKERRIAEKLMRIAKKAGINTKEPMA